MMLRLRNTVEHVERQKNVPYHMPRRLSHIIIFQVFALLTGFGLLFLRMVYMYQVNPAPKMLSRPPKAASIVLFDGKEAEKRCTGNKRKTQSCQIIDVSMKLYVWQKTVRSRNVTL